MVLGVLGDGGGSWVVPATILLACALVFIILMKGASGVDRIAKVLVIHVFVGLWMLYILVDSRWADLNAAVPAYASTDKVWNYMTGVEIGIVSLLSWWPYLGAMVRMSPKGRDTVVPVMLGMGSVVPLLSLIGIAGILALQVSDPAEWLRTVGGPTYAIIALAFVAAANLGTAVAGVYASAIGLRHFHVFETISWPKLIAIAISPVVLVGLFIPNLFFANFGTFLAFIGMGFAPLCGIQIADFFLMRRQRPLDVRSIFSEETSAFRYWGGFNPAAILGMIVGCGTYLYLLNPITYASRLPYQFTTASLPAVLMAGVTFVLVTQVFIKPARKGGYQ